MKKWIPLLPLLVLSVACNNFGAQSGSEFMAPQGSISRADAEPEIVMEPTPAAEENEPGIVVTETAPKIVVTETTPKIVVTETAPKIVVTETAPEIVVTETAPEIVVTETAPKIVVTETTPNIVVTETTPNIVVTETTPNIVVTETTPNIVVTEKTPNACNMLNAGPAPIVDGFGLMASVFDGSKLSNSATFNEMKVDGVPMDEKLFMPDLNFSYAKNLGFKMQPSGVMKNSAGDDMTTDFALEMNSSLVLDENEQEGLYQISAIYNDGLMLDADNISIISSDKNAPQVGGRYSGAKADMPLVKMQKGKPVPLSIKYYQGKTNDLALIVMWRKVKNLDGSLIAGAVVKDLIEKTQSGNQTFFDLTMGPKPSKEYQDLFDANLRKLPWKILKHKNYQLEAGVSNSVCAN